MKIKSLSAFLAALSIAAGPAAAAQAAPDASAPSPAGPPTTTPVGGSVLTVTFEGLESKEGAVWLALFDSADGYAASKPVRTAQVAASAAPVAAAFPGLPPGRYAIKAFHDLNGNGQLDVNPFGIPSEPYAFSNNAVGRMGPANWADAAFDVPAGAAAQTIRIR